MPGQPEGLPIEPAAAPARAAGERSRASDARWRRGRRPRAAEAAPEDAGGGRSARLPGARVSGGEGQGMCVGVGGGWVGALADHRRSGGAARGASLADRRCSTTSRRCPAGRRRRPTPGSRSSSPATRADRHGHAHRLQFRVERRARAGAQALRARSAGQLRVHLCLARQRAADRLRVQAHRPHARATCGGIASSTSRRRPSGRRCASRSRASSSPGDRSAAARRATSRSSSSPSPARSATAARCGSTTCAWSSAPVPPRVGRRHRRSAPRPRLERARADRRARRRPVHAPGTAARWRPSSGCSSISAAPREYGGLVIDWDPHDYAVAYDVEASDDGQNWTTAYRSTRGNGRRDYVFLPDGESRYMRLALHESSRGQGYGIRALRVIPLELAASPNQFIERIAQRSAAGHRIRATSPASRRTGPWSASTATRTRRCSAKTACSRSRRAASRSSRSSSSTARW